MGEPETREERSREGFRAWLGVLDAFKEAIEETIDELRQRETLSPERAKEAARSAVRRAQAAMEEARERLDLAPRRELEQLRAEVAELRRRVEELERRGPRHIPVEEA